jgi:DNA-directed RNA polymerase subunit RPC12/RpoP
MSLKCFSCRTVMFAPGDRVESRHNDNKDTIFNCPHCEAENYVRTVTIEDVDRYAIYRTKNKCEDIFFGPCENPDCIGHGVVVEPPPPTIAEGVSSITSQSVTDASCPDCGYTRMIIKSYI